MQTIAVNVRVENNHVSLSVIDAVTDALLIDAITNLDPTLYELSEWHTADSLTPELSELVTRFMAYAN